MSDWEYPANRTWARVPTLDEVDPDDRKAVFLAREQKIREDWIRVMEARLIREKLDKCYRTEGVNHYRNCRALADLYFEALKTAKVQGFRKRPASKEASTSEASGADGAE